MITRKRTKITVETERLLISRSSQVTTGWCEGCTQLVEMISVDEAALLARLSMRTIYRRVEAEQIHFTETADGILRICSNSLKRSLIEL